MWKALITAAFGAFLGSVGMDTMLGQTRFTFDIVELMDGIGLVPVLMGLFGIAEVLINVEQPMERSVLTTAIRNLMPSRKDWAHAIGAILRGSFIGFFLGVLPGGGAVISSFAAYAVEKKVSAHPEKFGTGVIQGVAGPEAANNGATVGCFIPLLTLGIPSNAVMAILLGALMIHGMQPGPLLMKSHPELFWGAVVSMYMGNVMLLLLNLPMIGLWVKILKIPYPILFPLILLFCLIGAYSINNSLMDVLIMTVFGVIGYFFRKYEYEGAPLVLALVMAPLMETALRRSLLISEGSFSIFMARPISAILLTVAFILLVSPLIPWFKKKREVLTTGDEYQ